MPITVLVILIGKLLSKGYVPYVFQPLSESFFFLQITNIFQKVNPLPAAKIAHI